MFDDVHPGIVAGLVGAVISILFNKILHGIIVFYNRHQVLQSMRVLKKKLRPVLKKMENYDSKIKWTKELDDAYKLVKSITASWYKVNDLLDLNERINSPTSQIYITLKKAQLVAAQAAGDKVTAQLVAAQAAVEEVTALAVQAAVEKVKGQLVAAQAAVEEVKKRVSWRPPSSPTPMASASASPSASASASPSPCNFNDHNPSPIPYYGDVHWSAPSSPPSSPLRIGTLDDNNGTVAPFPFPLLRSSTAPATAPATPFARDPALASYPVRNVMMPVSTPSSPPPPPKPRSCMSFTPLPPPPPPMWPPPMDFGEMYWPPMHFGGMYFGWPPMHFGGMYFGGHQARPKKDYPQRKKEKKEPLKKEKNNIPFQKERRKEDEKKREKSRKREKNRDKENKENEKNEMEENEEKMVPYEKECKNLLSSSEDPLHTISSSHQEEIHPQGLRPLSLSHSQSRTRRRSRGRGIGEYRHGNEADASAHPHFS